VIMTRGMSAALAAKKATATSPILMAGSGNPVGTGVVPGLAHPGGNVTGLSTIAGELGGKRLELLYGLRNFRLLMVENSRKTPCNLLDMDANTSIPRHGCLSAPASSNA